jgi:26S proteasome non-ATPase regulatory subunit 9
MAENLNLLHQAISGFKKMKVESVRLISQTTDITESISTLQDTAKSLISDKIEIEREMDSIAAELNSETFSCIGLRKLLTDAEGFPLSGIDIHQARTLRNRFATLSTDLDSINKEIETVIHAIHENARETGNVHSGIKACALPFGLVSDVTPGSPADEAGLLLGDKVVRFGVLSTIRVSGVQNAYDGIPGVIAALREAEELQVGVLRLGRGNDVISVNLRPRNGRVGCLIKPV